MVLLSAGNEIIRLLLQYHLFCTYQSKQTGFHLLYHQQNNMICNPTFTQCIKLSVLLCRWRFGSRTGAPSRRRTRGRTLSCAQWCQRQQRPAASSDCWSRAACWRLPACSPTAAAALWARPCARPPWPWLATAAAAAAAAARRAAALLYPQPPAQGQWQACRARRQLTASSASPCPPYSVALPPEFPPTPCPWPAHWLETCRNFLLATWAPLPLSLTRGPMAKKPWTRKSWNDTLILRRWIPVPPGLVLFSWISLSLFGFARCVSPVRVMFCGSSCIPVAHLAQKQTPVQAQLKKDFAQMFT